MSIWSIADLHLCLGVPSKTMEIFGAHWHAYVSRLEHNWRAVVQPHDLVLLAGDISWAMHLKEAVIDFAWIAALPGTKVMIRGNHDYWWNSRKQVRAVLPPSIHVIHNDAFEWHTCSVGGTRLWETGEYGYGADGPRSEEDEKIYTRELGRLERSLQAMQHVKRLVMTHYPPIGAQHQATRVSRLLSQYGVCDCVFGHVHTAASAQQSLVEAYLPHVTLDGVCYHLTSSDVLAFHPKCIMRV